MMQQSLAGIPWTIHRTAQDLSQQSWAVVREAAAAVLAYKLYPLGVATNTIPVFPSWGEAVQKRPPVLFIHGLLHNTATFACIKQRMVLSGWKDFRAVGLSTTRHSIPQMAEQTLETIERMRREFGVDKIDIVSHSLGGIVARYVVQLMKQDGVVRRLVTLGTPHSGTRVSKISLLGHLRDLAPEGQTIRALAAAPALNRTKALAVAGDMDLLMWPKEAGYWPGVRNVVVSGVGHAGLLFSRRVTQIIVGHLQKS